MPLAWKPARLPKPYELVEAGRAKLRFFHADSVDVLRALPAGSVSVVVTSPPYNLGIRYRSYDDSLPRARYLDWTDA